MKLFHRVLVIGLGQIGLPVAKYAKERGFDVYGHDVSTKAMERAENLAHVKPADDYKNFDVYIICVPTHKSEDMFLPQTDTLFSVIDRIDKESSQGALVSIESTIPRGTSRKVLNVLGHKLHVVHAPHRFYALEEQEHGVNQLRVISGVEDCCLKLGLQFYNGRSDDIDSNNNTENNSKATNSFLSDKSLNIPMHSVSKVEIAELVKIIENAHRYLQIAFSEELYLYCKLNDIDFQELRQALNTKWNVNILEPRRGIGGHCLPKDTKMYLESSPLIKSKILTSAIEVDLDYRYFLQTMENQIPSQLDNLLHRRQQQHSAISKVNAAIAADSGFEMSDYTK